MNAESLLPLLLTLPTVLDVRLSPDRRLLAFAWYRVHENQDIFVVPADGSAAPVALTHTPEATALVGWTPDARSVIVAEDNARDERVRLYRVDLARPLEMLPLTEERPLYFLRGGDLHPNGRWLVYGANYDFARSEEIGPTWIYRHDLTVGERTVLARPTAPAWTVPSLNATGTHVIYARKDLDPAGRQIHLVDIAGRDDSEILNFGAEVKVTARWYPDGARILVLSESRDGHPQDHLSVGLYDVAAGDLRWLLDDAARNVEGARVFPDGAIVIDDVRDAGHQPSVLDPETGAEAPFPRVRGNLLPQGRASDGAWTAVQYSSVSSPDLVRLVQSILPGAPVSQAGAPGDSPLESLVSLSRMWERTSLRPEHLTPAEDFRWRSVDGLEIQGWLYRARPNPRRAVVYAHGGPSSRSEDRLNPQIQYLVARGFNVLDANYRGSTGFGLRLRELIKEDGWGGREQADLAAGAEALIAAGLAAPGKVGVTGTSFGGYSSWCLITSYPPELVAAAAPICGMTDLVVDYETTRPDLRPLSEEMMGGRPDQVPQRYHDRSPIHFVERIRGRLLIVQGAQDPNVTLENVRQVVARLDAAGVAYELLVFEDEGHGIHKPANQARLYERLAEFFAGAFV
jgi:dipeptidyl aminopeptidase/acylaminoacyl peptidase